MREEIIISLPRKELEELIFNTVKSAISECTGVKESKALMTFEETKEFLSISSSTLFKWKKENKIPYHFIGKRIYFYRSEVLHCLKGSKYNIHYNRKGV